MTSTFSASLEHWPLDRLIPHARNAQTHSEDQVGQIAGSIAEFGFVNPILVGDDGVIVAGHGRDACAAFLDALHSRVNFRPSMTRGPIQYELDADWLAEVVGLELRNVVAKYPFERSLRLPGSSRILATETIRV